MKPNQNVLCRYCGEQARMVSGKKIYPHRPDLFSNRFYFCDNGHDAAYVGCHGNSSRPLGTVANRELRGLRSQSHRLFDELWKSGRVSRNKAYKWLSDFFDIDSSEAHIAMFDEEKCIKLIKRLSRVN